MSGQFRDLGDSGVEVSAQADDVSSQKPPNNQRDGLAFIHPPGLQVLNLVRSNLADAGLVAHPGFGME